MPFTETRSPTLYSAEFSSAASAAFANAATATGSTQVECSTSATAVATAVGGSTAGTGIIVESSTFSDASEALELPATGCSEFLPRNFRMSFGHSQMSGDKK